MMTCSIPFGPRIGASIAYGPPEAASHTTSMKHQPIVCGQEFDRLTVVSEIIPSHIRESLFFCRCSCGNSVRVAASKLRSRSTKSCGCLKRERATRHGLYKSKAYEVWHDMKWRCGHSADYKNRGITVCDEWQSFPVFLSDMGEPPPGMTLDRIDNDGNYELSNCRWATRLVQQNNRRCNIFATIYGRSQTISQWCRELGVKSNTVICRIRRGWTPERALIEPIGEWRGHN